MTNYYNKIYSCISDTDQIGDIIDIVVAGERELSAIENACVDMFNIEQKDGFYCKKYLMSIVGTSHVTASNRPVMVSFVLNSPGKEIRGFIKVQL